VTIGKGGQLYSIIPDWFQVHPTGNNNRNTFLFASFEKQSVYRNLPLKPPNVNIGILYGNHL
jgi:hypothetical protein